MYYRRALTIAGSDSGGGAGIQADIKTMSALGVYASSAITAVTVQNTMGVQGYHVVPADIIEGQIRAVMDDIRPEVVKIGMLPDAETIRCVHSTLLDYPDVPIVLDPVMVSTSGHSLMQNEAVAALKETLLTSATLVTPNIPEAEVLADMEIHSQEDIREAASRITALGAKALYIKGGHLQGATMTDRLYIEGKEAGTYGSDTVYTRNTHGTGCTLSSAIASYLALGLPLQDACLKAKLYISRAIQAGALVEIGQGHGPVNHFFNPRQMEIHF